MSGSARCSERQAASSTWSPFPAGPYEVPDEIGDGRPTLVVMGYEALAVAAEPQGLPQEIAQIFKQKGANLDLRQYRNNLVFVVADRAHSARP